MTNKTSLKRRFSCATDFTDEDCNRTVTISLETWTVAGEFLHSREKKNAIGNLSLSQLNGSQTRLDKMSQKSIVFSLVQRQCDGRL